MNAHTSRLAAAACLLVFALAAAPLAEAADRRFEPVAQSAAQPVKVVGDSSIISMAGKQFHAGASIAPESSRKAWLSVSIKNMSAAPMDLGAQALVVTGNGQPLAIRDAGEVSRVAGDAAGAKPAVEQLGSGQLLVRQYEMDLPQKSKTGPALIKVSVTLGSEQISFDFKEVD